MRAELEWKTAEAKREDAMEKVAPDKEELAPVAEKPNRKPTNPMPGSNPCCGPTGILLDATRDYLGKGR
jgi:hypothetical protein